MQYVNFGTTGLQISRLGFGGIPIQRIDQPGTRELLIAAHKAGINYIDTARAYTVSEAWIGQSLEEAGLRDDFILATKCRALTKADMEAEIATSLKNLRTDHIELFQFHNPSLDGLKTILAPGGAMEALLEAKARGIVGHIGITAHLAAVFEAALDIPEIETIMFPYNIVEQQGRELIDRCGFPRRLFCPLSQPGTQVGALLPEIAQAVGFDTQILLAPTHDTAAAVMAAPLEANDAYLSSGTWSLLGMELPAPILTPESRARNLTNEGGAQGTIRYLKNIMGLWMLQELRRELCPQTSFAELAALAERHDGYPGRVDCNAARFLAPVSMAAELRSALAEGGYPAPADVGDLAACVCHSLADCYRAAVDELEALTGRRIACLRVVGGGCRNDYLNRLTARALARPLTAGPAEATAIGNLLSQLLHAGEIHTLAEGRALVRASFTLKAYA